MVDEDNIDVDVDEVITRVRKTASDMVLSASIQAIRNLQRQIDQELANMHFALADIFKLAPRVSTMTKAAIRIIKMHPALRDAVSKILSEGFNVPLLALSKDYAEYFPIEITLSGDLDTAYDRCVEAGEDEVEKLLRQIYCGYAFLTLVSLIGVTKSPNTIMSE